MDVYKDIKLFVSTCFSDYLIDTDVAVSGNATTTIG